MTYVVQVEFADYRPPTPPSDQPSAEPARPLRTARAGLLALAALITELVLIAGTNNQGVTDWIRRRYLDHQDNFLANVAQSTQTYQWRVGTSGGYDGRILAAEYTLIGVTVLLSVLLVLAVCRGAITFFRAFFGTWTAVVFATVLASIARAAVLSSRAGQYVGPTSTKSTFTFFGPLSANAFVVVGSLIFGFVVALVVAIVAVSTRRSGSAGAVPWAEPQQQPGTPPGWPTYHEQPAPSYHEAPYQEQRPYHEPSAPAPWSPPAGEPPAWVPPPSSSAPDWSRESAETVDMTRLEADQRNTTALPRIGAEPLAQPESPSWPPPHAEAATTAWSPRGGQPEAPTAWPPAAEHATTALPRDEPTTALPRDEPTPPKHEAPSPKDEATTAPPAGPATNDTQVIRIDDDELTDS